MVSIIRVLLSGGGTGGHINPALSIAKKIKEMRPDSEIAFVGTPGGMENKLVPKAGFPLYHIEVMGFQRKLSAENIRKNVRAAYLAVESVHKAKRIVREYKPDIVIGTGGYVSWPVLKAAASLKIPTLIHEQNAVPGVTTKKLSRYVDRVMISFEDSRRYFDCPDEKLVLSGNPLDPALNTLDYEKSRQELGIDRPYILSFGGSLGARELNKAVYAVIKDYSSENNVIHHHAFGSREWPKYEEKSERDGLDKCDNIKLFEYIYDMSLRESAADLVICRAGAMTLSELAVIGKAAIFIPSPNVANNHQYKNALVYKKAGAAELIEEKDLTPERLIATVRELIEDSCRREKMAAEAKKLALGNADSVIYGEIEKLLNNR
ncbi:MAG: undecaprenyldiphospho-muramoylpentapeptide beta-N-acetylglucosaminyltransferase [Firmicutes bacterium]|nr:undecaprenyldiphospho-muramoylpentapeptide beta-N-acetylglucosaminyltransferase [Bacillota bacterium]